MSKLREGQIVSWGGSSAHYVVVSRSPRRGRWWWIIRDGVEGARAVEAMEKSLVLVEEPRLAARQPAASKEEGQELALSSRAAMIWKDRFKQTVREFQSGRRFTSEDVTAIVGLPQGQTSNNGNNAVGAMITALAKNGIIRKTSIRVPSGRATSHGAELVVWERI